MNEFLQTSNYLLFLYYLGSNMVYLVPAGSVHHGHTFSTTTPEESLAGPPSRILIWRPRSQFWFPRTMRKRTSSSRFDLCWRWTIPSWKLWW